MSQVVIVADPGVAVPWATALERDRHVVQTCGRSAGFENVFSNDPADIMLLDIENPDWSEVMLMPQARVAWPNCKIIAITADYAFRGSAIYRMGLWNPDRTMMKPVTTRLIVAIVASISAEIRTGDIRRNSKNTARGAISGASAPTSGIDPVRAN